MKHVNRRRDVAASKEPHATAELQREPPRSEVVGDGELHEGPPEVRQEPVERGREIVQVALEARGPFVGRVAEPVAEERAAIGRAREQRVRGGAQDGVVVRLQRLRVGRARERGERGGLGRRVRIEDAVGVLDDGVDEHGEEVEDAAVPQHRDRRALVAAPVPRARVVAEQRLDVGVAAVSDLRQRTQLVEVDGDEPREAEPVEDGRQRLGPSDEVARRHGRRVVSSG
mmetsp:Transcript_12100/g.48714  ORF Transcript_12100/g.48714 Transcript_12100/m.48714 type:complete len:228 (-) Transcript_12100:484-1167(-)